MSQTKYDVYEFLIKDKHDLIKTIKPGARLMLAMGDAFKSTKREEEAFDAAFKEYIRESLGILINNNLNLTLEQISDILDDEDLDDNIKEYFNQEVYK
jgi:hypothetical protein